MGYGKTAITLGCISSNPAPEIEEPFQSDRIKIKASLVVVPGHLMGQWPLEIEKFGLGSKNVLVIKNMQSLNKTCIDDFMQAEIVVVSFSVFSDKYFSRLARFSGCDPDCVPSGQGGRHFDDGYDKILGSLANRVAQLKDDSPNVYQHIEQDAEKRRAEKTSTAGSLRFDGKKAVYA